MSSVPSLIQGVKGPRKILIGPLLGIENGSNNKFVYTVCFLLKGNITKSLKIKYSVDGYSGDKLFRSEAVNFKDKAITRIASGDVAGVEFPRQLRTIPSYSFFRAEIEVEKSLSPQKLEYKIIDNSGNYQSVHEKDTWFVHIPPVEDHARIAYGSCNGWTASTAPRKTYDLWERMLEHQESDNPYSLLLMGGDQIYSDSFTNRIIGNHEKYNEQTVHEEYLDEYYRAFAYDYSAAQCLAQIPSIMMWDDHDICDGWGSYADEYGNQKLSGMQKLFKVAVKFFCLFQLRGGVGYNNNLLDKFQTFEFKDDGSLKNHFSLKFDWTDHVRILSLDLRSNRTPIKIMSEKNVNDCLLTMGETEYLYMMSSIPMAYVELGEWSPETGKDDLLDHWLHPSHTSEFERFIMKIDPLLQGTKVVILSGDVHHAGVAQLEVSLSGQTKPYLQLISSGIVHAANPLHSLLLEARSNVYDRDKIKVKLLKHGNWKRTQHSPGGKNKKRKASWYRIARTFLSISKEKDELNASWYSDDLFGFGKGPQTRMCSLKKTV